jgi:hypothetical protein
MAEPNVSVVIVTDFAAGQDRGFAYLKRVLEGVARQNYDQPVEHIFAESTEIVARMPPDLLAILPGLRVVTVEGHAACELKNKAVEAARGELVAMLDGDTSPAPDWLRRMVATVRAHPEAAVVSGKTVYRGTSLFTRTMAALTRAYVDVGQMGITRHISDNNMCFKRSSLIAHPFPTGVGLFLSKVQAEAIRRDGGQLYFEPAAVAEHEHDGWATEKFVRRGMGYGVIKARLVDPKVPYAWMARLGYLSIPMFIGARIAHGWWYCLRRGRDYGVAWYELPLSLAIIAVVCLFEAGGMAQALRGEVFDDPLNFS